MAIGFPEVFLGKGGFDAIVGNPPFLGGLKLKIAFREFYRRYLVDHLANGVRGVRGTADLVAYFLLRAHELVNAKGQTGLIATNTLAQGDTKEVGLDQIVRAGIEIRQTVKSDPWPSRSAVLEYCVVWTSRTPLADKAARVADGARVRGITSSLNPASRAVGVPKELAENLGIAFQGSNILGLGFTLTPSVAAELTAKNSRNSDVLFPYINGQDLNSRPDCSASRWVINFFDWTEQRAASYPECFEQVRRLVRPDRLKNNMKSRREKWWQYAGRAPLMTRAITGLTRVTVMAQVSKTAMPVLVDPRQVFDQKLVVFACEDFANLSLLSSAMHYWWAITHSATMKTDLSYSLADVFLTFTRPNLTKEMGDLGERLDTYRAEMMLARQAGLTKTYNLVHDPRCMDADIAELREIHRQIDHAVANAYGWDGLELDHGFHETRQGTRYTIGPAARQEILDRLLELNHQRYMAEAAAGQHKDNKKDDSGGMRLF